LYFLKKGGYLNDGHGRVDIVNPSITDMDDQDHLLMEILKGRYWHKRRVFALLEVDRYQVVKKTFIEGLI